MENNSFKAELTELINKHSLENATNTPDYILAEHLIKCLVAFESTFNERASWHKRESENLVHQKYQTKIEKI